MHDVLYTSFILSPQFNIVCQWNFSYAKNMSKMRATCLAQDMHQDAWQATVMQLQVSWHVSEPSPSISLKVHPCMYFLICYFFFIKSTHLVF
jgi:hypothetical protein